MPPLRIAIPIYPGCDMIDVAATFDPLRRIPDFWQERPLELDLVADPQPPFQGGDPAAADTDTYVRVVYGAS